MARILGFKFIRATRAALNTAAGASGLLEGEPYLITDEGKLAIGITDSTYEVMALSTQIYWQRNTTTISPAAAGDKLEVSSTSATGSRAIKGTAAGQVSAGVEGVASGTGSIGGKFTGAGWGALIIGTVVGAQIDGVYGIDVNATTQAAVDAINTTHEVATVIEATTSELTDSLSINRREVHNGGGAADGFGLYNDTELQTSTTGSVTAAREVVKWTTAAHATATSIREWWLKSAGEAIARVFAVSGAGQPTFDKLGAGTFTGTAAKYLAVTSAGLVIEQAVPDESKWTRTSTKLTPKTANDILEISTNDAAAPAIKGVTSGTLMAGVSGDGGTLGYGVYGEANVYGGYFKAKTTGGALLAEAAGGIACVIQNTATDAVALRVTKNTAATDALVPFAVYNLNSTGTASAGLGIKTSYNIEDAAGNSIEAAYVAVKWSAATEGSVSSVWEWYHYRAGTPELCLSVLATGQLVLPLYTGSSFSGTAAKNIEVDSSGNVLQSAPTTQVRGFRAETDSFTLSASYVGQFHRVNKSTAVTITFPKNSAVAIPVGTFYSFEQQGAGQLTLAPVDGDVTLNSLSSGLKTYGQYSVIYAVKVDTDVWSIFGGSA